MLPSRKPIPSPEDGSGREHRDDSADLQFARAGHDSDREQQRVAWKKEADQQTTLGEDHQKSSKYPTQPLMVVDSS